MGAKHTPGPLVVFYENRWPFDIVTIDADGNEVFRERSVCHSTSAKSIDEHMSCLYIKPEEEREKWCYALARQFADARMRAAAPDLLEALELARKALSGSSWNAESYYVKSGEYAKDTSIIHAAIAKAKGE